MALNLCHASISFNKTMLNISGRGEGLQGLVSILSSGVGFVEFVVVFVGFVVLQVQFHMTLSKMMTLLSSAPGDRELRDFTSGAMYSR